MALQISVNDTKPSTLSVSLDGQLDSLTAPDLDKSIQTSLTQNIKTLVFDLQNLNFIASAGLRVFAKTRKALKSRGGDVFFINITPQVKKVFDIVKAVPLSEVFANVEELDKYLAVMQSKLDEDDI